MTTIFPAVMRCVLCLVRLPLNFYLRSPKAPRNVPNVRKTSHLAWIKFAWFEKILAHSVLRLFTSFKNNSKTHCIRKHVNVANVATCSKAKSILATVLCCLNWNGGPCRNEFHALLTFHEHFRLRKISTYNCYCIFSWSSLKLFWGKLLKHASNAKARDPWRTLKYDLFAEKHTTPELIVMRNRRPMTFNYVRFWQASQLVSFSHVLASVGELFVNFKTLSIAIVVLCKNLSAFCRFLRVLVHS